MGPDLPSVIEMKLDTRFVGESGCYYSNPSLRLPPGVRDAGRPEHHLLRWRGFALLSRNQIGASECTRPFNGRSLPP